MGSMNYIESKATGIVSINALQDQINELKATKQDTLDTTKNIKTINGETIVNATGDIKIPVNKIWLRANPEAEDVLVDKIIVDYSNYNPAEGPQYGYIKLIVGNEEFELSRHVSL